MKRIIAAVFLSALLATNSTQAATYYIDFDAGADTNDGTATTSAFKHSPGDAAAGDKAAAVHLQAGDTVIFKGGVHYRGTINAKVTGEAGKPITFDGNTAGTFGTGKAIIEGAEPLKGWKKCASADEALGNPNWSNLYYTDEVPAGADAFTAGPYQGNDFLFVSEAPLPTVDFWWDELEKAKVMDVLPQAGPAVNGKPTQTLLDATFFTQTDPHAWDGAYIAIHAKPNRIYVSPVVSYDPAAHQVTYEAMKITMYSLATKYDEFFMLNSMTGLVKVGQYVLASVDGKPRLFCWPLRPEALENDTCVAVRNNGIVAAGANLTIQGFHLQHFAGKKGEGTLAIGIDVLDGSDNLVLQNNEISYMRNPYGDRAPGIRVSKSHNITVVGNNIHDNSKSNGAVIYFCDTGVFKDNLLRANGDTATDFYGCKNMQVTHNKLTDSYGPHANGLTFYVNCENIVVDSNTSICVRPITFELGTNFRIINNVFDAVKLGNPISIWPENANHVVIENNTMVNANSKEEFHFGIMDQDPKGQDVVVRNNIFEGITGPGASVPTQENNLTLGKDATPDQIFVDYAKGDYHLKAGSPAIGMGKPSDVKTDIEGNPRPDGKNPDVGAYQFQGSK